MAATAIRFIIKQLSKQIAKRVVSRGGAADQLFDFLEEQLGGDPANVDDERREQAIQMALDRGVISENDAEALTMVEFQTFMSVGLNKCGADRATFKALTDLWNRQKDEIQAMTVAELRSNLQCP